MALVQGTSYTFNSFDSKEFFYHNADVVVPYNAAASLKVDGKSTTETFKLVSSTVVLRVEMEFPGPYQSKSFTTLRS